MLGIRDEPDHRAGTSPFIIFTDRAGDLAIEDLRPWTGCYPPGSRGIDPSGGCDLVRGGARARCKAARAKRVDDERVRKCASHVGELVQSHPSSAASAVLTAGLGLQSWRRTRRGSAIGVVPPRRGGGEGGPRGRREKATQGGVRKRKAQVERGRKLRCSVSQGPPRAHPRDGLANSCCRREPARRTVPVLIFVPLLHLAFCLHAHALGGRP